jgi:hypothetical protein
MRFVRRGSEVCQTVRYMHSIKRENATPKGSSYELIFLSTTVRRSGYLRKETGWTGEA